MASLLFKNPLKKVKNCCLCPIEQNNVIAARFFTLDLLINTLLL